MSQLFNFVSLEIHEKSFKSLSGSKSNEFIELLALLTRECQFLYNEIMLDSRSVKILKAAVRDYIMRGEPIASEDLYERHSFGVKPASIRSELLNLTTLGFLIQPHTSSGRVPTEKGYRFFVDEVYANIFDEENSIVEQKQDISFFSADNFIDNFSKELKLLGLSYNQNEEQVYKTGLDELCSRINFKGQEEFLEVVRDFERLDKSMKSLLKVVATSNRPQVFIGSESPVTSSAHLSLIADIFDVDDEQILIVAIGPKRMDYAKPLKLFKEAKGKHKSIKTLKHKNN